MTKYALKVKYDGTIKVIELPEGYVRYGWYRRQIGCDYIEIVRPVNEPNYVVVVDEEGLLKDHPRMNVIASDMYGTFEHDQPIVGDCLIMKEEFTNEGVDLAGMPKEEAEILKKKLEERLATLLITGVLQRYIDKKEKRHV